MHIIEVDQSAPITFASGIRILEFIHMLRRRGIANEMERRQLHQACRIIVTEVVRLSL
jgi:hypothetical protein